MFLFERPHAKGVKGPNLLKNDNIFQSCTMLYNVVQLNCIKYQICTKLCNIPQRFIKFLMVAIKWHVTLAECSSKLENFTQTYRSVCQTCQFKTILDFPCDMGPVGSTLKWYAMDKSLSFAFFFF